MIWEVRPKEGYDVKFVILCFRILISVTLLLFFPFH